MSGSARIDVVNGMRSTSSRDDDTMSIHSADQETARCFRFFPTGKNCLHFYFVMFLTLAVIATCVVVLVTDASDACTFQTLLATCVAFWMQPPTL